MKRFLILFLTLLAMSVQGAITRTQQVNAVATNVAITSATANDIILVFAYNAVNTTIPGLPAGFTSIVGTAGTAQAARLGYKIAVGGETSSGTWSSANGVVCHVYRGAGGFGTTPTLTTGSSTTLTYSAVTMQTTSGSSWVAAFGAGASMTAGMNGTPTGSAPNLVSATSATKINGLDTNTGISSNFTAQTLTVTTTGGWMTVTVEVKVPSTTTTGPAAFFSLF